MVHHVQWPEPLRRERLQDFPVQPKLPEKSGKQFYNCDLRGRRRQYLDLYAGDPVSTDVVYKIYPGQAGRFYLSTSNGMSLYDPASDAFLSFNESNGLLHNQVTSVVEDTHGNPWLTTPKGLHKLDLSSGTFTNYGINDGLPDTDFTYQQAYRDDVGQLYFPVDGKLLRFHPDSLKPRQYVAPVHLLDFYLNHNLPGVGGWKNTKFHQYHARRKGMEVSGNWPA